MTYFQIFEKYNLTEKEVHTLQVMKACRLTKTFIEAGINYDTWKQLIKDGILLVDSYCNSGRICKVSDFVHE